MTLGYKLEIVSRRYYDTCRSYRYRTIFQIFTVVNNQWGKTHADENDIWIRQLKISWLTYRANEPDNVAEAANQRDMKRSWNSQQQLTCIRSQNNCLSYTLHQAAIMCSYKRLTNFVDSQWHADGDEGEYADISWPVPQPEGPALHQQHRRQVTNHKADASVIASDIPKAQLKPSAEI